MKRNDFIKILGLSGAATLLSSHTSHKEEDDKEINVIVIGAGISGIAAAKELQQAGVKVQIIEARERIGGRIHTVDFADSKIELGAGFVKGARNNKITQLVDKHELEIIIADQHKIDVYDSEGTHIDKEVIEDTFDLAHSYLSKSYRYGHKHSFDISMAKAIHHTIKRKRLSEEKRKQLDWKIAIEEINDGADYDNYSLWGDGNERYIGPTHLLPNGLSELLEILSKGINIKLNTPVQTIDYSEETEQKVIITSTKGEVFKADYVISTLPAGVLKSEQITFNPGLPGYKKKALNDHAIGHIDKVAIKFKKGSWTDEEHFIGLINENPKDFPLFINMKFFTGSNVLIGEVSDTDALALDELTKDQKLEKFTQMFSKLKSFGKIEDIYFSSWSNDIYALGSTSYIKVNESGEIADALARRIKRLHFAGEATFRHEIGTLLGAYDSGLREAKAIINKIPVKEEVVDTKTE